MQRSSAGRARLRTLGLGAACGLLGACSAGSASAGAIAFQDPRLQGPSSLSVSIAGLAPGAALPTNYAFGGRNLSPPATWTRGPPGTRAYALILQDPDAPGQEGAVHWLAYAIPPNLSGLPRGMKNVAEPKSPLGVLQGANYHGSVGYSGPNLSPDDPAHHYHLQVFALDAPTRVRPGASLPAVERAMAGHVIARGELVAAYQAPQPKSGQPQSGQPQSGQAKSGPPQAGPPGPAQPDADAAPGAPG